MLIRRRFTTYLDSFIETLWSPQRRVQHLSTFRKFEPSIGDSFKMPKNAGRKPRYQSRERHKESPDIIIDRLSTSTPSVPIVTPSPSEEHVIEHVAATEEVRFLHPRESTPEVFELHFRKNLPRQITKCQGMCGKKITPDDNGLLVRTYGTTTWTERGTGREMSKYGPMYIHFSGRCLKAFDSKNYYEVNDTFDYQRIIVEKNVQAELRRGELEMLLKLCVHGCFKSHIAAIKRFFIFVRRSGTSLASKCKHGFFVGHINSICHSYTLNKCYSVTVFAPNDVRRVFLSFIRIAWEKIMF